MFLRLVYLLRQFLFKILRWITVGVRVILVKGGKVLLVRQTYVDGWYFPGGGLKRGETVETAARREVREETGAEMGEVELVGIYSNFDEGFSSHTILFACRDFTITGQPDHEIAEVRSFSLDELPADLNPGLRCKIEEFLGGGISSNAGTW
jgi:ADP-ribose pyrophosphatase YjhB (NUDIX family)